MQQVCRSLSILCAELHAFTSAHTTQTSGPNGSINWLNCGVRGDGWKPPHVRVENLISHSLESALADPKSPFHACAAYVPLFEKYGHEFGVPAILLASFAMQESTCNRNAVGGGGEQGIMQISKDKCHRAPDGDCKNPVGTDLLLIAQANLQAKDFNIRTAADFFSGLLKSNGDNVLLSIGSYNGWVPGMTVVSFMLLICTFFFSLRIQARATAAAHSACCRCQNNLD